jgi:hypothetical protein
MYFALNSLLYKLVISEKQGATDGQARVLTIVWSVVKVAVLRFSSRSRENHYFSYNQMQTELTHEHNS